MSYTLPIQAQKDIELKNPSFEDAPAASSTPIGWQDCGQPGETPPDTQPNATFQVTKPAKDGSTYIGLVTRDSDTWESVGQILELPLQGGKCYDFSLYLARSESYLSRRKNDATPTQFTQPIKLRVWGGNNYCDKKEMLAETGVVEHTNWKAYEFKLSPVREMSHIVLEAFYMTPTLVAYNGNLLIDNCSAITLTRCPGEKPLFAKNDKPKRSRDRNKSNNKKDTNKKNPKEEPRKSKTSPQNNNDENPLASIDKKEPKPKTPEPKEQENIVSATPPPAVGFNRSKQDADDKIQNTPKSSPAEKDEPIVQIEPKPKPKTKPKPKVLAGISEIDETAIEEGQIIRVDKLRFPANKSVLTESSYEILEEVYDFLTRNQHIIIEIGGHTNGVPSHEYCNKLSKERAESVARYLIEKGINKERIAAEGYGKTQPIADNDTMSGRKKNQRVEIKIISVKG